MQRIRGRLHKFISWNAVLFYFLGSEGEYYFTIDTNTQESFICFGEKFYNKLEINCRLRLEVLVSKANTTIKQFC